MYCPNCAAQIEGTKFCKSCGANVSLVPTALTGRLPEVQAGCEPFGRRRGEASIEGAARSFFFGIGFLLVSAALAVTGSGTGWWFYMLIPAFGFIGTGVAQYMKVKSDQGQRNPNPMASFSSNQASPPLVAQPESQLSTSRDLRGSVTEETTRQFKN